MKTFSERSVPAEFARPSRRSNPEDLRTAVHGLEEVRRLRSKKDAEDNEAVPQEHVEDLRHASEALSEVAEMKVLFDRSLEKLDLLSEEAKTILNRGERNPTEADKRNWYKYHEFKDDLRSLIRSFLMHEAAALHNSSDSDKVLSSKEEHKLRISHEAEEEGSSKAHLNAAKSNLEDMKKLMIQISEHRIES